jgi:hypothetical protein
MVLVQASYGDVDGVMRAARVVGYCQAPISCFAAPGWGGVNMYLRSLAGKLGVTFTGGSAGRHGKEASGKGFRGRLGNSWKF